MDDMYGKQVVWILRQTGLTPAQLKQQYVAYKEKRGEFEGGLVPVADMTALITPGVLLMLDLEEKMLDYYAAAQRVAGTSRFLWIACVIPLLIVVLCVIISLAWLI